MSSKVTIFQVALCGPSDVAKEIGIASEVIQDWNLANSESRKFFLKSTNWRNDSYPDMSDRSQGVINKQLLDTADIVVAIFWSRFGSSTGIFASGTEEEIYRGIHLRKKVMVYFSKLEPLPATAKTEDLEKIEFLRIKLASHGLYGQFSSRSEFRALFSRHLELATQAFKAKARTARLKGTTSQSIVGNGNIQVAGDYHHYENAANKNTPPLERRPGSVSREEEAQLKDWISILADETTGMDRNAAYGMWTKRLKNKFRISKIEHLLSSEMPEAKTWFKINRAIGNRELKAKAPELWRINTIAAIKTAMKRMGRSNEDYYPEVSARLKMKKVFTSLKLLTKTDLNRVYSLVSKDVGKFRKA